MMSVKIMDPRRLLGSPGARYNYGPSSAAGCAVLLLCLSLTRVLAYLSRPHPL